MPEIPDIDPELEGAEPIDDEDLAELAAYEEDAPVASKEKAEVDPDEEFEEYTIEEGEGIPYLVSRAFVSRQGESYEPGQYLEAKCKNCALWKRLWAGQVRCDEGIKKPVQVQDEKSPDGKGTKTVFVRATPDGFSCRNTFICQEMDVDIHRYMEFTELELQLIRRMRIGMRRMFGGPAQGPYRKNLGWMSHLDWAKDFCKRRKIPLEEAEKAWQNAITWAKNFDSYDQIDFMYEFLQEYPKRARKSRRRRFKSKSKGIFKNGDILQWTHYEEGIPYQLQGTAMNVSGKTATSKLRIVCTAAVDEAGKQFLHAVFEYKLKQFVASNDPTILERPTKKILVE
jgi:hypothetical protein